MSVIDSFSAASEGYATPAAQAAETIRSWDAAAIEEYAVPGLLLMENAGEASARALAALARDASSPVAPPFHVVCGPGNNGGDGLVIARHLHNRGLRTQVDLVGDPDKAPEDSDPGINLRIVQKLGLPLRTEPEQPPASFDAGCIVDALFGTGLDREVRSPQREWIDAMNASPAPTVAIDVPSGLHADESRVLGTAVQARYTFTFVAPKLGFERDAGPSHTGDVLVVGISVPRQLLEGSGGS